MDTETGYFRLGLFILTGVGLLVAGVVALSSAAYNEDSFIVDTVTLESAQGLDPGAPVKFRGVRIGHVRKIELAYIRHRDQVLGAEQKFGNAVILELGIRPSGLPGAYPANPQASFKTAVEHGLRARIASSSLTGPPYVELVFLDPETNPPLALPWKPGLPYLPAGQSTFARFVDAAQEIIESIRQADVGKVIGHADALLVNANKAIDEVHLAELRDRALALLDEVRDSNKRLQSILKDPNIEKALSDFAATAGSLKQSAQSPELKAFLADLPQISDRLKHTVDQLDALTNDPSIKKTLANLSQASAGATDALAEIRRLIRSANTLLASQQQDIASIIKNLRNAAENANAITEDAKANPARLFFGQPPPKTSGDKP